MGEDRDRDVAVVGMSGRFPGARDVAELWRNLCQGVESIAALGEEELLAAGVEPELLADPRYVRAKAVVEGEDLFDAAFFGFSAREAEVLDPQHRLFLETAWQALEDAGCDPSRFPGLIGVYAGVGANTYAWNVLAKNPGLLRAVGGFQAVMANDKDFLPTMVSYKLDLRGPSFSVQCACSTSLVAIYLASQALLSYECDLALAGGATIAVPQRSGYLYQEGGILSPDGRCRPFDARARGTAPGSGVGVVVLKRLAEALADGDTVWAVVKGGAVNNDGARKVGYTAPSVAGQADVIAAAQAMAGVEPASVTYVEAHGTATPLGDPIEIAALTQAFGTEERGFCAVGSVKSNFGHLDTAAGVAGFVKAVLALKHRQIPPSLHFERPNPGIDLAGSPFWVPRRLTSWETDRLPRRAGVSSFGIGGTNAHLVLEEPPELAPTASSRPAQLLVLSARTAAALERAAADLAGHLRSHPDLPLADVAHTLQTGRRAFAHRRALVCRAPAGAAAALSGGEGWTGVAEGSARPVAFLFPGQGAQHPGMGLDAYRTEPAFSEALDRCAELLSPHLGLDLRHALYPEGAAVAAADRELAQTRLAQPALFAVEYALAQLWAEWGVRPEAMLGHSVGELVAACLAGVFSLEEGLALVAARGRLVQSLPPGSMLAVPLPEAELAPLLAGLPLSLAAANAPALAAVSGPAEAVEALRLTLAGRGVEARPLRTSHAFHSAMVEPVLPAWEAEVRKVALQPPAVPFLSNVTGAWITAAEATDPGYWVRHLRAAVRFAAGLAELLHGPERLLLEVGPGRTLATLTRQNPGAAGRVVLASLAHPRDPQPDGEPLLAALGRLWIAGATVDWAGFAAHERRRKVPLPTYPFERKRYWAGGEGQPLASEPQATAAPAAVHERPALATPYVAPRDEDERAIAGAWEELLGIRPVGVRDDFFEAGGSSLLAVSLMARIEERLGRSLPVSALSQARTVETLARHLRAAASDSPLVTLRPEGKGLPFFWVHPIGGEVLCYLELARRLGGERPVYAFRALGLADGERPAGSVEEMAEAYLSLLAAAQPAGPYRLGGWSFGGLVAWEMARRLEERGEEVALLALLDSFPPALRPGLLPDAPDEGDLLAWFLKDLAGGRGLDLVPDLAPERLAGLGAEERWDALLEAARRADLLPRSAGPERLHRLLAVFRSCLEAARAYLPRSLGGPVLLLTAAEDAFAGASAPAVEAWAPLASGGIDVRPVPGDHYSMMAPPQVEAVAAILAQRLEWTDEAIRRTSHAARG